MNKKYLTSLYPSIFSDNDKSFIFFRENYIKIFSAIGSFLIIVIELYRCYQQFFVVEKNILLITEIINHIINIFSFILFEILFFLPHKVTLFSTSSFLYAVFFLVNQPLNPLGIFMYFLGVASLADMGLFNTSKRIKVLILSVIYILLTLSNIRFGISVFITSLFQRLIYVLVSFMIFTFVIKFMKTNLKPKLDNVFDLRMFPDFSEKDKRFLKLLLENKSIKEISEAENLSEPAVKKNLRKLYCLFRVSNRKEFLFKYANFHFIQNDEEYNEIRLQSINHFFGN